MIILVFLRDREAAVWRIGVVGQEWRQGDQLGGCYKRSSRKQWHLGIEGQHWRWWSESGYFWKESPQDLLFSWIWAMREKKVTNDSNVFGWSNYVNDGAIF